jgi:hypothetical protein
MTVVCPDIGEFVTDDPAQGPVACLASQKLSPAGCATGTVSKAVDAIQLGNRGRKRLV